MFIGPHTAATQADVDRLHTITGGSYFEAERVAAIMCADDVLSGRNASRYALAYDACQREQRAATAAIIASFNDAETA